MPSATRADAPAVLHTPPGFDRAALLGRLNSTALEHSPEYRRAITRTSPLLFSCVYLLDHLRGPETGDSVSLSTFHVELARAARRWIRRDLGAGEIREAWIAPRGSGKSSWCYLALPLWAMAHEHPAGRFVQAFADSGAQARQHLATLRAELEGNALLQRDFPELCTPARRGGRAAADRAELYVASSGAVMGARGLDASSLGVKVSNARPSLLLLDDVEPDEANYDASTRERRLAAITSKVLPMSVNAVVQWAATTTAYGSLAHDLVLHALGRAPARASWIDEHGFRPRYFPAIVLGDDGAERSLWPQRWPLEWLQAQRHTRSFALNYQNLPPERDTAWWSERDIVVDERAVAMRRELFIDPAVTADVRSDFTALAVVGVEAGPSGRAVVEWARQVRVAPEGLRELVAQVLDRNPTVRVVHVEANQGGAVWEDVLGPVAVHRPGVRVELHRAVEAKRVRLMRLLDRYQRREVVHARKLQALADQLLAWPDVAHDDLVDVVAAGVERWLGERPR